MNIAEAILSRLGYHKIGQAPTDLTTTEKLISSSSIPGPTFTTVIFPGWQTSQNNLFIPPDPGLSKDEQVAEFKNTTYDAIDFIARFFAAVPYKIFDRSGKEIENHPFHQITENPFGKNSTYDINQIMLFYSMVCDLLIFGNVIWLADPDIKNIKRIFPLSPQLIDPVINKTTGLIEKYVWAKGSQFEITYPAERILHIQFVDPAKGARFKWGKSPIAAHADILSITNKLLDLIENELKKLGIPSILAKVDGSKTGDTTEGALTRIKEAITNKFFTRKEPVAVIDAELMDITLLQMNLSDFQFDSNTEIFTRKVASMFHLDPMFLGLTQTTNRAQAEAAIFMFTKFTIKPLLDQIESQINSDLIHIAYGDGFTFKFDEVVPEDIETLRANLEMGFKNGSVTPNEIRTMLLGLDEIKGIPAMNQTYLGFALVPISAAGEQPNPEDEEILVIDDEDEIEVIDDEDEKVIAIIEYPSDIAIAVKSEKQVSREAITRQRRKWQQLFNLALRNSDDDYTETLQKFFNKQMNDVDKRMREFFKDSKSLNLLIKQDDDEILSALDFILFDIVDATGATMAAMNDPITALLLFTGEAHIQAMELPISFDDVSPGLFELLETGGRPEGIFKFAKEINITTDAALRKTLTDGIKAGETIQQLSERIAAVKADAQGFRAVRIARTEIIGGYSRAAATTISETVEKFGGVAKKFWYTSNPAERHNHNKNEAEAQGKNGLPLEQRYAANNLLFPGDPEGEAGEVINCLCVPGHIIEGLGA